MDRPKCRCFQTPDAPGTVLVDTIGSQLMSQLDEIMESVCMEAAPYVLATWAMGVAMVHGLEKNLERSDEDRALVSCDVDVIRRATMEVVALIPAALEARLALLEKSDLGSGAGRRDN